jgi:hypothetical protein
MPALARSFCVVAPDQRGRELSGKPAGGYDTTTLAGDLVALMGALGHEWFAVAGHDIGVWIGYALADPDALRSSFADYRAFDATIAKNRRRTTRRLTMPVLAIAQPKATAT